MRSGNVIPIIDDYARTHGGAAPIFVFVDSGGRFNNDTECVNGPRGNVADHLTKDIRPFMTAEQAVHRLTGELADWYRIDAGHLRVGDRADLVVLDPERLDDSLDEYAEERVDQYGGLSRMVNRNDATVNAVIVGGRAVFLDGKSTDLVGKQRTGRFLRAAHKSPAVTSAESELASVG